MDNEYKLGQGNEENKENQEMPNGEVNFVLQEMPKEKEQEVVQTTEPMQEHIRWEEIFHREIICLLYSQSRRKKREVKAG